MPIAWEAFVDYRLKALSLTRHEVEMLQALSRGAEGDAMRLAIEFGLVNPDGRPTKSNRERSELEAKITTLGFELPWSKKPS